MMGMGGLSPVLANDLRVVFCGTAVGEQSAARGHYYAGRGNKFWSLLYESGLTNDQLRPEDDRTLHTHGLGLTDLAPGITQSHDRDLRSKYDLPALIAELEAFRPEFVAFTSLEAGRSVAKLAGHARPELGLQPWTLGPSRVFILPSPSGANNRAEYGGRPDRLAWWAEFGRLSAR